MGFYERARDEFTLYGSEAGGWRGPQFGAIGAIAAHWSLDDSEPTVISIPTGSGKTAIAMVAPLLTSPVPTRVLVLVPNVQLREQIVEQFSTQSQLISLGVLSQDIEPPSVHGMTGRTSEWDSLRSHDVVVALPNSISPAQYEEPLGPPADLFDMVIVDEAHHAPASTWQAVLDHFAARRRLLLTATPRRRDGRRIPGSLEFYYPLRRALEEGLYNPINPHLLPVPVPNDREASDGAIAAKVAELLASAEHATSTLLVRGGSIDRLKSLKDLYGEQGVEIAVLHNRLSAATKRKIVDELRAGGLRGVAVVGMLGEGFDLPSLRIAAYHDKHRSVPSTIQMIGRLARVASDFPQRSALVTVGDTEVYPELKGVLKELYDEDADWAKVLPGILDEEIAQEQEDRRFVARLAPSVGEIDPLHLQPVKRAFVYEVARDWEPNFLSDIPDDLHLGTRLRGGGEVAYVSVDHESALLVVVVRYMDRPRWSSDPALEDVRYELNLAAFLRSPSTRLPGLVLMNLESDGMRKRYEDYLGLHSNQLADPERLGAYLDSLDRISVSSVGIRSTDAATRGRATYKNFMGGEVDRGLRQVDMARSALGHVMFQIRVGTGSANAGGAVEKSKIWMTRYGPLREFSEWATSTAKLIWFPDQAPQGKLLPGMDRGRRLERWPAAPPLAAEIHPAFLGIGLELFSSAGASLGSIENLDLYVNDDPTGTLMDVPVQREDPLRIIGVLVDPAEEAESCIWEGELELDGSVTAVKDVFVGRGYGSRSSLAELLTERPPTVYFRDGTTTIGALTYGSRGFADAFVPRQYLSDGTWNGVDLTAETRMTAAKRGPGVRSIHESLEAYLLARPKAGPLRWILFNDGSGEIADYLVVEQGAAGGVRLELWHAKAAGGTSPSVRIDDLQVVVAQALRSRRWFTSTKFWGEIAARLTKQVKPYITVVDGSDDVAALEVRLGLKEEAQTVPWTQSLPAVQGLIGIAQPGLGLGQFEEELENDPVPPGADGLRQLLSVLADTTISDGAELRVLVSV